MGRDDGTRHAHSGPVCLHRRYTRDWLDGDPEPSSADAASGEQSSGRAEESGRSPGKANAVPRNVRAVVLSGAKRSGDGGAARGSDHHAGRAGHFVHARLTVAVRHVHSAVLRRRGRAAGDVWVQRRSTGRGRHDCVAAPGGDATDGQRPRAAHSPRLASSRPGPSSSSSSTACARITSRDTRAKCPRSPRCESGARG